MANSKLIQTLISTSSKLSKTSGKPFANLSLYHQIVGALQYLTLTKLDIAVAMNKVYEFMHNPSDDHWSTVKLIYTILSTLSKRSPSHL